MWVQCAALVYLISNKNTEEFVFVFCRDAIT
jgi:hypothetical protein